MPATQFNRCWDLGSKRLINLCDEKKHEHLVKYRTIHSDKWQQVSYMIVVDCHEV